MEKMLRSISMKMRCTVIGNGPSRKGFTLHGLRGVTIGCNQIYTEYQPHFLVAQDLPVLEQMARDGQRTVFVPRDRVRQYGNCGIPNMQPIAPPSHGNQVLLSGHWAILLAANLGFYDIRCLGFDHGPESIYRPLTKTNTAHTYQCTPQRHKDFMEQINKIHPHVYIHFN